jgi:hypothetical protein
MPIVPNPLAVNHREGSQHLYTKSTSRIREYGELELLAIAAQKLAIPAI